MTEPLILSIESSCDETSAAVLKGKCVLSNIIASQKVHENYGGVVPELASRAHQSNIVPVAQQALVEAGITKDQLQAIAFTQGPGLMGSLHVGVSFAKSFAMGLNIPLIAVNHIQAHILSHFLSNNVRHPVPEFPFLCLTVSGGHTQIALVKSTLEIEIVGSTIDDAAGEAFDKAAKLLGLPYPGGPLVDKKAAEGDDKKFNFNIPDAGEFNYSFSGLKTALLYFLQRNVKEDEYFIEKEIANICASYQRVLVKYLLDVLFKTAKHFGIQTICLAGGVSANSALRRRFNEECEVRGISAFIPPLEYCTDNAAMIGIVAYFKFLEKQFASINAVPMPRMKM